MRHLDEVGENYFQHLRFTLVVSFVLIVHGLLPWIWETKATEMMERRGITRYRIVDNKRNWWRIWAKSLGEKSSECNREADKVALVRTVIVLVNFVTCFFIMANAVHHW